VTSDMNQIMKIYPETNLAVNLGKHEVFERSKLAVDKASRSDSNDQPVLDLGSEFLQDEDMEDAEYRILWSHYESSQFGKF